MPAISGSVVAPPPVASTGGRKSGIVEIWLRAQKYVPIAKAETSITNAETVAVDTRNPRRQWGWAPAPSERAGSFGFLGSWDIGLFPGDSLPGRPAPAGGGGEVEWLWDAVVRALGIEFFEPYERVLDVSRGTPWATWFGGGTVNLAHDCVDRWAERTPAALAGVWEGEEGDVRRNTYAELRQTSDRLANGLASLGVEKGDAVGIFLPMTPEAVAAVMACAKLGAVFLPIFSGFGADAVAMRLADAEAKVLITADGFPRRGKTVAMKETADEAIAAAPSVRHVVVVSRGGRVDAPWTDGRDVRWDELLAAQPDRFETAHLD